MSLSCCCVSMCTVRGGACEMVKMCVSVNVFAMVAWYSAGQNHSKRFGR